MSALDRLIESVEAGEAKRNNFVDAFATVVQDVDRQMRYIHGWYAYHEDDMNAALSLFEALLPGWGLSLYGGYVNGNYGCSVGHNGNRKRSNFASAQTPARALLIAVLKAHRDTRKGD